MMEWLVRKKTKRNKIKAQLKLVSKLKANCEKLTNITPNDIAIKQQISRDIDIFSRR